MCSSDLIILGPWPHGLNAWRDCRDVAFGNNAIDYDFDTRIIRWFDRYLKGIENGEDKKARARYYLVGENKWKESADWNPIESTMVKFYLGSSGKANSLFGDGTLALTPAADTVCDNYIYDPENLIGDDGHVEPYHCNTMQLRNDCLVYDTNVLENDLAVAGNFYTSFYAASTDRKSVV